jgi:two-component SAPR family response regulator
MTYRPGPLTKKKNILKNIPTHNKRLTMLYGWIKQDNISNGSFIELMAYLEVVDDVHDAEFTAARLKELKEREIAVQ